MGVTHTAPSNRDGTSLLAEPERRALLPHARFLSEGHFLHVSGKSHRPRTAPGRRQDGA